MMHQNLYHCTLRNIENNTLGLDESEHPTPLHYCKMIALLIGIAM